jgi:mannan endo-1,4-beta-mannosidase
VIALPAHRPRSTAPRWSALLPLLTVGLLLVTGCGPEDPGFASERAAGVAAPSASAPASGSAPATAPAPAPVQDPSLPYNVTPLLSPARKYVGVALEGVPQSVDPVKDYAAKIGKQPNLIEYYAAWGDGFDTTGARRIYEAGALPYMAWEPHDVTMASIAAGTTDDYVKGVATAAAKYNLPIAISIAHEMNGDWYPWGRQANSPADFVAGWKHVHDLFTEAGATNVIWVWSPNIIIPAPNTRLEPYYPGDAYVDWAGMTGYFTLSGPKTFDALYGSTMAEIRSFTRKPFIISETASEGDKRRRADIDALFNGLAAHDDVIGFVWFNIVKRADWRVETSAQSLSDYKKRVSDPRYGFDIRKP